MAKEKSVDYVGEVYWLEGVDWLDMLKKFFEKHPSAASEYRPRDLALFIQEQIKESARRRKARGKHVLTASCTSKHAARSWRRIRQERRGVVSVCFSMTGSRILFV
jgi:hypothetical protein